MCFLREGFKAEIDRVCVCQVLPQESLVIRDAVPELLAQTYCLFPFLLQHGCVFVVENSGRRFNPHKHAPHSLVKTEQKHADLTSNVTTNSAHTKTSGYGNNTQDTRLILSTHDRVYSRGNARANQRGGSVKHSTLMVEAKQSWFLL